VSGAGLLTASVACLRIFARAIAGLSDSAALAEIAR